MLFVLYSINCQNFIARLFLLLDILVNICKSIACSPHCDVNNFEINQVVFVHAQRSKTKI